MSSSTHVKQIVNLLVVLFSGVAIGALLIAYSLSYYEPNRYYLTKDVLLAPSTLDGLRYVQPQGSRRLLLVFDRIEYYIWDREQWKKKELQKERYEELFNQIAEDRSIVASDEIKELFTGYPLVRLILLMKADHMNPSSMLLIPFQEVQIALGGDYYRIEQHNDSISPDWIYFKHEGIRSFVFSFFTK